MKDIVLKLINNKKTIATMESCTGGAVVNALTNIEGASEILKFSAVTYSNEYKIKMGVDSKVIDEYSVYSMETAKQMSKKISDFCDADYGVGITGKLNRPDINNAFGDNNIVYISIYDKENNKFYTYTVAVSQNTREENKKQVLEVVIYGLKSNF